MVDPKMAVKPRSGMDIDDAITTGPQPPRVTAEHRKGGLVKKPIRKYQHGGPVGVVKDTGPGAASASSRPWSANMKGRDVTMKAKGGKVGAVAKGRRS